MNKIPLLDLEAQIRPIKKEILRAMQTVIDTGQFILGDHVKQLEKNIVQYVGGGEAIGVSSGTEALVLALQSLGVGPGDEVVCPAFTYYATAGAAAKIGAKPVFCDIDPLTFNICPRSLRKVLSSSGSKCKAVIVVHLYGLCADMDSLLEITRSFNVPLVEDNAQSFGALYKGRHAGTFGACGTLSFFPGKNLGAFGDAGMILTQNPDLALNIRSLRNQGTEPKDKYDHMRIGTNARLDTIQAAVLIVKLGYIDQWNCQRGRHAEFYCHELRDTGIKCPIIPEGQTHVFHQFTLRSPVKEKIRLFLVSKGIDSRTYYPKPLHLQPCFKDLGYKIGQFPESEKASLEVFSIPCYPELSMEQREYVVACIKEGLEVSQ